MLTQSLATTVAAHVLCAALGALRQGDWKLIVGPESEASWFGMFSPNVSVRKGSQALRSSQTLAAQSTRHLPGCIGYPRGYG